MSAAHSASRWRASPWAGARLLPLLAALILGMVVPAVVAPAVSAAAEEDEVGATDSGTEEGAEEGAEDGREEGAEDGTEDGTEGGAASESSTVLPDGDAGAPVISLEDVRVDAEAPGSAVRPRTLAQEDTPRRVDAVTSEDLVERGVFDLEEAMRRVSGGALIEPTGTSQGLSIDGLSATQVVVLRDGRPIGRPTNTLAGPILDLRALAIDPAEVERIEIWRGTGPPGSGSAGGVILNIVTRPPDELELHVRGGGILHREGFIDRRAQAGAALPLGERNTLRLSGQFSGTSAVDVNGDERFDTPETRQFAGALTFHRRPRPGDSLRLRVAGDGLRTDALIRPDGHPQAGIVPEDRTRTQRIEVDAEGIRQLPHGATLRHLSSADTTRHEFAKRVPRTGVENRKADTRMWRGRQLFLYGRLLGAHLLEAEVVGDLLHVSREGETGALDEAVTEGGATLALTDTWMLGDTVELESRATADLSSAFGVDGALSTALGWTPAEALTLRSGVSLTRRLPSAEERFLDFDHSEVGYRVTGNPDLLPERLLGVRGGFVLRPATWLGMEAESFIHRLGDAVESVLVEEGSPALFSYANQGRARVAGLNASATADLPAGLHARIAWTWLPLRENDAGETRLLTSAHSAHAELGGGWWQDRLCAGVRLSMRSALAVPEEQPAAPGFATVDLHVAAQLPAGFDLRAEARNVADQTNATWGPRPGRSVLLLLGWRHTGPEAP